MFVGRAHELAELQTAVADAARGHGSLSLLRAEAGMGKTRLATELHDRAEAGGQRIYWGYSLEGAGAPAFWLWVQVLRSMIRDDSADLLAGATETEISAITRLLPEVAERSRRPAPGASASPSSFQIEIERFQLFDGITACLQRIAAGRGFGLVLEDLHAADPPSLLLLEFIARRLAEMRVWIVGTYRPMEAHLEPQRSVLIANIARLGRLFDLTGFSEAEVGQLIENAVGEIPPPSLRARIADLTGGNPFFVDEVARLLWSRSDPAERSTAHLAVPSGVREVLRQRLHPLSDACRRMLQIAAAIGPEPAFALLREASGIEAPQLLDLLAEATQIGVLLAKPERRYAFAHALMRESLYEDLLPSRLVELHRAIGEAIERLHQGELEPHLPELAFHFARVAPAGDAARALAYAEGAARRAEAALAYEDAARLYQLALDTLPLLGAGQDRELDLLLALGDVQVHAADSEGARATFERAARIARARCDWHGLARAAVGCGGLGLGVPPGTVDRALVRLLEDALRCPEDAIPGALRARLLARLGLELYFSDATERRRALMDEASALTADSDPGTRAFVMHAHLVGLWDLTPPEQRLRRSNELISLAETLRDEDLALRGHSYRLLEIIDTGMAAAWQPELDTITRLAERLREPRFLGMVTGTRAMSSVWLGRFDEAEALGQQAIAFAQPVSDLQIPISVAAQTFFMRRLQGRAEEVEMTARATVAALPSVPGTHCMLALALCDLQQLDEARRIVERFGDSDFDQLRSANRLASLVPWLAEICTAIGDVPRMRSLQGDLAKLVGRNISLQARVCFGPADFYLGLICTGLGQPREGLAHFDAARDLAQRLRGRPLVAMIEVERARSLFLQGDTSAGHAALARARAMAAPLGLQAIITRAATLEIQLDAQSASGPAAGSEVANGQRLRPVEAAAPTPRQTLRASLRRDRKLWTIAVADTVLRCRSSKGLHYLAHLVSHPGKSFHVLELIALDSSDPDSRTLPAAQIEDLRLRIGDPQTAEPIADAKAIAAYRRRIEDLATELVEATQFNDLDRRSQLQAEIDILSETLASAVGIGGRLRTTGSFGERARLNVTRALRSAIERIAEGIPILGRHLDSTIRTGTFCSYLPSTNDPVHWDL